MGIDANDVVDAGFVSEDELVADGATSFRSETIVSIVSGTISFAANTALINYDDPIQDGDIVVITGNAAAGTYTVSAVNLNLDDHEVDEAIVDAAGGTATYHHPSGSTRVGVDPTTITGVSANDLQGALEELGANDSDEQVKVSANDTTPGYLNGKLVAGANTTLTEQNDGGNETLEVASEDEQVKVSANDTTEGYLDTKLTAGLGITLTEQNDGANENLEIASATAGGAFIQFGDESVSSTTTTRYLSPGADTTTGTSRTNFVGVRMPRAGTLQNLYVEHNDPGGNGNAVVYTVEVNATPSTLSVSLPGTSPTGSDLVNSVVVAQGDVVSIEVTKATNVGGGGNFVVQASVELV